MISIRKKELEILELQLIGKTFGTFKVLSFALKKRKDRMRLWNVHCNICGYLSRKTTKEILQCLTTCVNCSNFPQGQAGLNRLYHDYIRGCNRRKLEFNLSIEEFKEITSGICHYCGTVPVLLICATSNKQKKYQWGNYFYNGIDRKNPNKIYNKDNCVSCCWVCNRAKSTMLYEEFIAYINNMINYSLSLIKNYKPL